MSQITASYRKKVSARLWPTAMVGGSLQRIYGASRVAVSTTPSDTTVLAPYDTPVDIVTAIAGTAAASKNPEGVFPANAATNDTNSDVNEIAEPLFLQFDSLAAAVNYLDRWTRRRKLRVSKKRKLNAPAPDVDEGNSLTVSLTSNGEARIVWLTNGNIKYRRVNADPTSGRNEWTSPADLNAVVAQTGKAEMTSVHNGFNLTERSITLSADKKRRVPIPQNIAPILYEIACTANNNGPFTRGKFVVFMGWIYMRGATDPRLMPTQATTMTASGTATTWYDNNGAITWVPLFLYSIRVACKVTLDILDLIDPVAQTAAVSDNNFPQLPGGWVGPNGNP